MQDYKSDCVVLMAFSCLGDDAEQLRMVRWWESPHVRELLEGLGAGTAVRFESQRRDGEAEQPTHLAVFEVRDADLEVVARETTRLAQLWRTEAAPDWHLHICDAYETIGSLPVLEAGRDGRGLLMGLTDCVDAARHDEFNQWYDEVHAGDVLRSGLYWSARRYRRIGQEEGPGTYAALYETESAGRETFVQLMRHYREHPSPMSDVCTVRHVWTFDRI